MILLDDGSSAVAVVLREAYRTSPELLDISDHDGWRSYREQAATAPGT